MQLIKDQAEKLVTELKKGQQEGSRILEDIRKVAAEQGVSQQAVYFKEEAAYHSAEAEVWRLRLIKFAWVAGGYAVLSLFLHRLPWIAPVSGYETTQLAVSKFLIFGILSFLVYLAAKNFLAHKHNAIVNKHRQNGLMTFKALVDAAGAAQKDIVLSHAAAAIFAPQPTGYSQDAAGEGPSSKSIVELVGSTIKGEKG